MKTKRFFHDDFGYLDVILEEINDQDKESEFKPWFMKNQIFNILGYRNSVFPYFVDKSSYKKYKYSEAEEELKIVLWPNYNDRAPKYIVDYNGAMEIITRCTMISIETKEKLTNWIIEIASNYSKDVAPVVVLAAKKEVEFFAVVQDMLNEMHIESQCQYYIDEYAVDFYIPEYNIVVEYDEDDHRSYDQEKEKIRQDYITRKLGCYFLRIPDFCNLGKALAKIIIAIKQQKEHPIIIQNEEDNKQPIKHHRKSCFITRDDPNIFMMEKHYD